MNPTTELRAKNQLFKIVKELMKIQQVKTLPHKALTKTEDQKENLQHKIFTTSIFLITEKKFSIKNFHRIIKNGNVELENERHQFNDQFITRLHLWLIRSL